MTKSECYSQISTCNAGIEEDQKKIREWEEKIDLYENTNRRLERGQENMADFCSCHSRKIRQTRDYFPQVKYVEGYVQDMTEYLQGAEYNSVNGKFDGAIATINRKKQEAISEIEKLKNGAGKNKEPETAGWHQDYREAGNRNMQSLGYDLIVDDDGIIQEAGKIVEKTEDFEQKLGELSDILSNVLDDAIMQGNTAENLMLFADEVQGLRSEAQEIAEQVRRAVENYVTSMDEADSYVY